MNRLLLAAVGVLTLILSHANAGDFKLPEAHPTCTITLPDSWKPQAYEDPVDGVSAQTADGAVFICAECIDTKSVGNVMEQGMKWFHKNGVTVNQASLETNDKFIVNGIDGSLLSWNGTDGDGPCIIQMAVLPSAGDKGILVEYWSSPDSEKQYSAAVAEIMHSIRALPSHDTAGK